MFPEKSDFDEVVRVLEAGGTPRGVDHFSMRMFYAIDEPCGTVACLYGSAVIGRSLREGGGLPPHGERVAKEFGEWVPTSPHLATVRLLCYIGTLRTDEVVTLYRAIGEDGFIRLSFEEIEKLDIPSFDEYISHLLSVMDFSHLHGVETDILRAAGLLKREQDHVSE